MSDYGRPPLSASVGLRNPGHPAPTHLVWSILSTVLWFPLLAIVSIVLARQVKSRWAVGDIAGAWSASIKAKLFAISATVLAVIQLSLIGLLIVAQALPSLASGFPSPLAAFFVPLVMETR